MKQDYLTLTIDNLLNMIKDAAVVVTGDEKYSLCLLKESITTHGKTYEIIITDKSWTCFGELKDNK